MLYRIFIKQYIKFQQKTAIGKIFNFFGKIFFGKIAFVTGYAPDGKEMYKTTTSRRLDKVFVVLKETGYSDLEEHSDIESVENSLRSLASKRRRCV